MDKFFLKTTYIYKNEMSTEYYTDKLLKDIRETDLLDIPPECDLRKVITESIKLSDEVYVYFDIKMNLLCIAGLTLPSKNNIGREIWMLATKHIYEYKKEILIKESKKLIKEWVDKYCLLTNMVNIKNTKSINWLQHFGAVFLPDTVQAGSSTFREFYIAKEGGVKHV